MVLRIGDLFDRCDFILHWVQANCNDSDSQYVPETYILFFWGTAKYLKDSSTTDPSLQDALP